MIPHPVVGIALLSIAGRNHPIGRVMQSAGIEIMGTVTGLVAVLTFVGLPFTSTPSRPGSRRSRRGWSMSPAAWEPRPAARSSG
jgi:ABC-type sulfate transport system permease component